MIAPEEKKCNHTFLGVDAVSMKSMCGKCGIAVKNSEIPFLYSEEKKEGVNVESELSPEERFDKEFPVLESTIPGIPYENTHTDERLRVKAFIAQERKLAQREIVGAIRGKLSNWGNGVPMVS